MSRLLVIVGEEKGGNVGLAEEGMLGKVQEWKFGGEVTCKSFMITLVISSISQNTIHSSLNPYCSLAILVCHECEPMVN